MGALFVEFFNPTQSFDEYSRQYKDHDIFTFMLNGKKTLDIKDCPNLNCFH